MSLLGSFDDWLTGQPQGTTDAQNAADAAADAQLAQYNQETAAQIANTQGAAAAAAYTAQVATDYSTDAPAPGSLAANGEIAAAGAEGALQAVSNPASVFGNGLNWLITTLKNSVGTIFGDIPWYFWIAVAVAIFLWLGGGGFLERKGRKALSA